MCELPALSGHQKNGHNVAQVFGVAGRDAGGEDQHARGCGRKDQSIPYQVSASLTQ